MALTLTFRHYFSDVTYKQFYTLNQDGSLAETNAFNKNLNGTYNAWNVDLRFSWWFAPGSQLTLLYRNATSNYLEFSRLNVKKTMICFSVNLL
jgi:RAB protein geranylgeranyltransferase component A